MMFNKILTFSQNKANYLYKNSLFLQHIDTLIFLSIVFVFILSTFMSSDIIGFCALITGFLTLIKLLTKPGTHISCKGFELWLLAYFMLVVVSLFGSSLFLASLKGFFKTLTYLIFYSSLVIYLRDNKSKIPFLLGVIALCLGSQVLLGLLQNFAKVSEISTWQDVSRLNPEQVMTRVYGSLKPLNPNLLGGYLVLGMSSVFAKGLIGICDKNYRVGAGWILLGILTVIAIVLTGCRGAYLALFASFATMVVISAKFFWDDYKKLYISIIGGLTVFATAAVLSISSLRARVVSIFAMRADSSNSFRFNVYNSSIDMFKDNWLLGIGIGNLNFREIYGLYMKTGFDALSAYNIFLETAVESGIFALIAFGGFLLSVVVGCINFVLHSGKQREIIIISAILVSLVATIIHGMVDTVFFRPQLQFIFWFMMAVASVMLNYDNECNA